MPIAKYPWTKHHPDVDLGFLPYFLWEYDPRPVREQFNERYKFGGWDPVKGFSLTTNNCLQYPGDPPLMPIAETKLRDELIILYRFDWVAIIQPDRSFEVARLD